jgi:hypothetical protein
LLELLQAGNGEAGVDADEKLGVLVLLAKAPLGFFCRFRIFRAVLTTT